jgi:UDP-3-O-[3-hydroxymyristoyl] N-acetylglucosamine deacetylase
MGLHSGARCSVVLERRPGPLLFNIAGHEATLADIVVTRTDHGVSIRSRRGSDEVDLVEHLFAAFAGLSIRSGITTTLPGPEVPLLDGGATELSRALLALGAPRQGPALFVADKGTIEVEDAEYEFEPLDSIEVGVEVDFERGDIGRQSARFTGNATRFLSEIAPARTFGFAADAEKLRARGRARFVDPHSVIVLDEEGRVLPPGSPPRTNELARHKLLDLMGDLFVHGGPPRGRVSARRPGHRATHQAVARALERGFLLRR